MSGLLPNCGPTAVAHAVNASVSDIMDLCRSTFKFGASWKGRTLASWVEWETKPGVSYIVRTGGHFQHVKDGIVSDQHMSAPVDQFHWNTKRVTHVIELKG